MIGKPSPRGKKPDKQGQTGPRFGSPLAYVLLVLVAFLLLRTLFQDAGFQRVPYSRLVERIRSDGCAKVILSQDWVKCYAKPGTDTPARSELPWFAVRVPGDTTLVPLLEQKHLEYEAVTESSTMDLIWMLAVPVGLGLLFVSWLTRRMSGGMPGGPPGVMSFGKTKARIYMEAQTGVSFKDVAGIDEAVDELKEIVEFLKTPNKFRRLGGRIPKGVLLVGPPGTGKTLLARAVAGEAGVPFFSLSGSEFVEMFVGVGAARVRDLFQQAAAKAPAIIFIDELDAIGKSRNAGMFGGHDEREQTLNQMLAEMDGFDARTALIVIAATNRPEILDPALMRPGRFDRQVLVDRPDKRGREQILRIHAREVKLGADVDLREVAGRTPGFAGADLANVVNESALLAARKDRDKVVMADFMEAIERVVAGLEKKTRRMNEKEKEIVAYHESGHAVVSTLCRYSEPVTKISIIPRGLAALGYTLQLPLEDRYLMSREELLDKMAGLMGGRAAEEIMVGSISTGASNDLKQATEIARLMVVEYGMSEAIGPVNLAERRSTFLNGEKGFGGFGDKNYSEQMQRRIDDEVSRLLEEAMTRARDLVSRNREALGKVAARLLAIEVIEGDELRRILVEAGAPVPEKRGPAAAEDDRRGEVIAPVPPQDQAAGA
ncbi:MAG: ATP-dependent zinc metalloprotease FtsH [Deltaproteobacteria bacterium]|nr:MAG: ATP-dependent zinc metalloprotease FtsH [Deltaproteobacteria bacterium]